MEDETRIATFIVLGCCVMFFLVLAIIVFVVRYQRRILQKELKIKQMENEHQLTVFAAAISAEENQKQTIAANLHDTINPNLSVALQYLRQFAAENKNTAIQEKLSGCENLIRTSLEGIREACYDLVPITLNKLGLAKAIGHLIYDIRNSTLPAASFHLSNSRNLPAALNSKIDLPVLRIAQELLNNVIKHSAASWLDASLYIDDKELTLEIKHDGRGLVQADLETVGDRGLGLRSIQSRVLLLQGTITYSKGPDNIYSSRVTVPIVG
jgi:two-component system NarL family sensor kinase